MNRIDARFAALKSAHRTGLIAFVTAGDPALEATVPMLHAIADAGADLIELGVPFSDPMADGPTIQHANERALARGVGLPQILAWVREFRQRDSATPVVLMGYLNPLEIYGYARFATDAKASGVDGMLLVDCPFEESATAKALDAAGLARIFLAAPTTSDTRLANLCNAAQGFLYYVSFAGITGANRLQAGSLRERVASIRTRSRVPVAVGFGVRDAQAACEIAAFADAVVIGSALVERVAQATSADAACAAAREFLVPIRVALDARRA